MAIKILVSILMGYILGNINPAYIIGRIKGFDIRKKGSGNAGASNAVIIMGKKIGLVSAVFDILKAYAAFRIATVLFTDVPFAGMLSGVSCILGHIFPVLMNFKGGKGLACLGGLILAYNPWVFLIMLGMELVLVFIVDYICFVPITASIAFPIIYASMSRDLIGMMVFLIATIAMLYKHVENIRRIRAGKEMHFSYLWRKEKELDRFREKGDDEQ